MDYNREKTVQLTYNNIAHAVTFYVLDFAAEDGFISADQLFNAPQINRLPHMLEDLAQLAQILKMLLKGNYIAVPLDKDALDALEMSTRAISGIHNTPTYYVQALASLNIHLNNALRNSAAEVPSKQATN